MLDKSQGNEDPSFKKEPPNLIVGRDGQNHWVVVETHGRCGGLFADEAAALRYAREESRGHPDAVRVAPYVLVLKVNMDAPVRLPARR
jgi:hypothetical protein